LGGEAGGLIVGLDKVNVNDHGSH